MKATNYSSPKSHWRQFAMLLIMLLLVPLGHAMAQQSTPYARLIDGVLTFYYNAEKAEGDYDIPAGTSIPAWNSSAKNITKVAFDPSFKDAKPTSCANWFKGASLLESIEGLEYLNTSRATSMSSMFYGCEKLTHIDLSHFDTQLVTNMYQMFYNCKALQELDVSKFKTDNVKGMGGMFYGCEKLTRLDLSNFNTEKVYDMMKMFSGCVALQKMDLSHFNTSNVTNMYGMFSLCHALKTLDLSSFVTDKVTNMTYMFHTCHALTTIYVMTDNGKEHFNTDAVTQSTDMFYECNSLKGAVKFDPNKTDKAMANTQGYFTDDANRPKGWAQIKDGTLTFSAEEKPEGAYELNEGDKDPGWYYYTSGINKVVFDPSFAEVRPTSCLRWFADLEEIETIEGIENLNTSKVTNMKFMFFKCRKLQSIDLSHFNTANVESMYAMFSICQSLQQLDVSKFNTEKVTTMKRMFNNCISLASLDLTSFNTENVTTMEDMFSQCRSLVSLDVSSFNTGNVTTMGQMFNECSNIQLLDLTSFDTKSVQTADKMFAHCSKLATIYVSDKFIVNKGDDMFNLGYYSRPLQGAVKYDPEKTSVEMANYHNGYFKTYWQNGDKASKKHELYGEQLHEERLDLTDDDFTAHAPFTIGGGSYSRKMTSGWGTLCLPFTIDVTDADNNCRFYAITQVGIDHITLEELTNGTVEAGTPVVVRRKEGATGELNINAKPSTTVSTQPVNATEGDHLVGTFKGRIVKKNGYYIAKDRFWQAKAEGKTGVNVRPFRAYIECDPNSLLAPQRADVLDIETGGETNDIDSTALSEDLFSAEATYYDLQGQRIPTLQRGINIVRVGGKTSKIIIK